MALGHYQQSTAVTSGSTLLGGWAMAVAGTAGTAVGEATAGLFEGFETFGSDQTILGLGNMTGFTENIEKTTMQAGNSSEPDNGVANHTATITFETLEFHPPNWDIIRGGNLDVPSTVESFLGGSAYVFSTGGLAVIDKKAFAFYNTKLIAGITVATIIVVYAARIEAGMVFTPKSDHDTDPVMVIPFTITAELATDRTVGEQLFRIETDIGL